MSEIFPTKSKTIALVGMMGVGKSSVGRRLAAALHLPFRDADTEVEIAAGRTIVEIFEELGESAFREGERRVIARLLDDPPHVLATGGGAFAHPVTRALIRQRAISVWLKTDLEVLARRVGRRSTRPLLQGKDSLSVLTALAAERYETYGEADICIDTADGPHSVAVDQIIQALKTHSSSTVAP